MAKENPQAGVIPWYRDRQLDQYLTETHADYPGWDVFREYLIDYCGLRNDSFCVVSLNMMSSFAEDEPEKLLIKKYLEELVDGDKLAIYVSW